MGYRKELFRGGLAGGAVSGLGQAGNIFLKFFLSRLFGPTGIGLYEIGLSVIRIGSSISQGGISQIMVKYLAKEEDNKVKEKYVKGGLLAVMSLSLAIALLLVLSRDLLVSKLLKDDTAIIFWVLVIGVILWSVNQYIAFCLRGYKRIGESVAIQSAMFPFSLLLTIFVLYFIGLSVEGLFLSLSVSLLTVTIAGVFFLRIGRLFKIEKLREFYKKLFSDSIPVWFVSIARILSLRLDKIILALFVATDLVGIYAIGFLLASIIRFVPSFITPVSQPLLAKYLDDRSQLQNLYHDLILFSTLLMLPAFMFLIVNGKYVLSYFGERFSDGYLAMIILAFGIFFNGLVGPTGNIMIMGDQQKKLAIIQYLTLGLFVLMSFLVVPHYGILGAAVTRSFTWVCAESVKLIYINRIYGLKPFNQLALLKFLLSTALFLFLAYFLGTIEDGFYRIASFIFGWSIIYGLVYKNEMKKLVALMINKIK